MDQHLLWRNIINLLQKELLAKILGNIRETCRISLPSAKIFYDQPFKASNLLVEKDATHIYNNDCHLLKKLRLVLYFLSPIKRIKQ